MPHWPVVGPFGLKEGKAEGESSDSEGDSDDDKKSYKSHSDAEDVGPKTVTDLSILQWYGKKTN